MHFRTNEDLMKPTRWLQSSPNLLVLSVLQYLSAFPLSKDDKVTFLSGGTWILGNIAISRNPVRQRGLVFTSSPKDQIREEMIPEKRKREDRKQHLGCTKSFQLTSMAHRRPATEPPGI